MAEWFRRQVAAALRTEIDSVGEAVSRASGEVADLRAALDALASQHDSTAARQTELDGRIELLGSQHASTAVRQTEIDGRIELLGRQLEAAAGSALRDHLDTRIDQTLAEVADLRSAYLLTRGEFEALRDERLSGLERSLSSMQEAAGRLQAELELLRDATVPQVAAGTGTLHASIERVQGEVAELRETRVAQAERDLAGFQSAIEALQADVRSLADVRVAQGEKDLARLQQAVEVLQRELRATHEDRLARHESDLAALQEAISAVQREMERLVAGRVAQVESGLAAVQGGLLAVQRLAEEVRDARLPALAGRTDALVEQLHLELTTIGGLVDRLIAAEPIRVVMDSAREAALPAAITQASAAFVDALRGSREEIASRVAEYVPLLEGHRPILDLGCGRGELLETLQREGIEARGVDLDPAMVAGCRRRGLAAIEGDAVEVLAATEASSVGAVTAIHLLEHLPAAAWMSVIDQAARVLEPGGILLVECPNPESLRVGGGLFWSDPTHRSPVHPQPLALTARALGLEVVETRFLHPFPPEQSLTRPEQSAEVRELAARLDAWLSGPRDFLLIARKPPAGS